jgi:hypothetical protein
MIMGGTTSALQTVQAKVGEMRTATAVATEQSKATPIAESANIGMPIAVPDSTRDETMAGVAADVELPQPAQQGERGSGWNSLWSWIPGTSRP